MQLLETLVLCCCYLATSWSCEDMTFPENFLFGSGSSAYQIEGAWNVSDKGESIWDRFTHDNPSGIFDGWSPLDGDVACDSYHNYKQDVAMAKLLGLHFYRFSISWSRLLPDGFPNKISEDGRNYYSNLIDELLVNGIEPIVTLYHLDLPQKLQDLGGWTNPLIEEWFGDYATIAFLIFGDRVKTWVTINQPIVICDAAYNGLHCAPGIIDPDRGAYICNKNVLLAHARAYRIYDEVFRILQGGRVGIVNMHQWYEPETPADEKVTELARQYRSGRYLHPIYSKKGGWPKCIEEIIEENSIREGYFRSRLPAFTDEQRDMVRGSFDFMGINFYTSRTVRKAKPGEKIGPWFIRGSNEIKIVLGQNPNWETGPNSMFSIYPEGIRKQLVWLKKNYGDIPILITENGYPGVGRDLLDKKRIKYLKDHMKQVLLAIKKDAVNVFGYAAWSLMDEFEFYSGKLGLFYVDFESANKTRIPRASAYFYRNVIRNNALLTECPHYYEERSTSIANNYKKTNTNKFIVN